MKLKLNVSMIMQSILKLTRLFTGYMFASIATVMMINSKLGLNPWGIFFKGISIQTGLSYGQVAQLSGLIIIFISLFLKIIPGIGTIFNMYFFGLFVDIVEKTGIIPLPDNMVTKIIMLLAAILIYCTGIYLYLSCKLGAGPKDGLMLGLVKKFNMSVSKVRMSIEIVVLVIGYMLGGPLGIGTVILSLSTGPVLQKIFKIWKFDAKKEKQLNIKELIVIVNKF